MPKSHHAGEILFLLTPSLHIPLSVIIKRMGKLLLKIIIRDSEIQFVINFVWIGMFEVCWEPLAEFFRWSLFCCWVVSDVIRYENGIIFALADGCNWGWKPRNAAYVASHRYASILLIPLYRAFFTYTLYNFNFKKSWIMNIWIFMKLLFIWKLGF